MTHRPSRSNGTEEGGTSARSLSALEPWTKNSTARFPIFQFDLHTATQPERRTGTGFASVLTGLPACKAPVAYWHHTIKNWGKVHESYSTKAVGGTRVVFCVGRVGADLYHHRPWGS